MKAMWTDLQMKFYSEIMEVVMDWDMGLDAVPVLEDITQFVNYHQEAMAYDAPSTLDQFFDGAKPGATIRLEGQPGTATEAGSLTLVVK